MKPVKEAKARSRAVVPLKKKKKKNDETVESANTYHVGKAPEEGTSESRAFINFMTMVHNTSDKLIYWAPS
jgi:hypothetical protein